MKESLEPIMHLLRGKQARDAGIVYLQDEEYTFQTKEGGKRWTVYGSPVSVSHAYYFVHFCDNLPMKQRQPHFAGGAFPYVRGEEAFSASLLIQSINW